ncbi:MAG: FHA domain-containing protein [Acidimicrobiia bacterium]|nr:FHA domain-containing protein [Acidimicrobiia bacterium]
MGLQSFERRLERLVEGAFTKAFRSGLQPVEIGRKMVRAMDSGRTVGLRGTVAPNRVTVLLSQEDAERFGSFHDALVRELVEAARNHAHEEGYHFVGPVTVELVVDPGLRRGDLDLLADIAEGAGGRVGALVLPDGQRVGLGEEPATIGRLAECTITIEDPRVSRRHAEVHPDLDGYVLRDLGSTNGTTVNGVQVREHALADGDAIGVGETTIRFEAS